LLAIQFKMSKLKQNKDNKDVIVVHYPMFENLNECYLGALLITVES
jgi:hypothetical protein